MAHGTHDFEDDARNERILIWVNGELVPRERAVVSVFDAGFVLGDGVWEGLRVRAGHPAFLERHLDRLFEGAKAIMLDIGRSRLELTDAIYSTLRANDMTDGVHVRLMVTRGVKRTPYQDPRVTVGPATVVIIAEHKEPLPTTVTDGITLFTTHVRRAAPDTLDPKLNAHSKLSDIIACIQAYTAGADEALMLDPHGFVATCNSTHFFIVVGPEDAPEVLTSDGRYCLAGITRANVLEICRANSIAARETTFSLTDVYAAREAFVTGTFAGVVPVRVRGRSNDRRWPPRADGRAPSGALPRARRCRRRAARSADERRRARGDVVRPAEHLHGLDARVREPSGHSGRRRAAVRGLPRPHRHRPPRARGGHRFSDHRSIEGRVAELSAPLPTGGRVHYAKHMAHHVSRDMDLALDAALPQRAADPRPDRSRRLLRTRARDLRARGHRASPAGVALGAVGQAPHGGADPRRERLSARARGAPALAV